MKYLLTVLCILLLTVCCAPFTPADRLISVGFYAYQPMPYRRVVCYTPTLGKEACNDLVPAAIHEINAAANHRLFWYAYATDDAQTANADYLGGALVVAAGKLPENILGLTVPEVTDTRIEKVFVLISASEFTAPTCTYNWASVLAHEFGHSVGLNHSALEHSLMWPAAQPNIPTFTEEDRRSLRAVYSDGDVW